MPSLRPATEAVVSHFWSISCVKSVAARLRCNANLGPFVSLYEVLVSGVISLRFRKPSESCFGMACKVTARGITLRCVI